LHNPKREFILILWLRDLGQADFIREHK